MLKNIFKYAIASMALVGTVTLSGCSDDTEDPFAGVDSHFNSFVITTAEGVSYNASITGDDITLRIPVTVSLEGATASYTLCEQARVIPDPKEIIDWNEDQVFRLISYNGTVENYNYKVVYDDIYSDGAVTLATQADVDEFASRHISVIEGNLVIGSTEIVEDAVVNIAPLRDITLVKGAVIVLPTFNGSSLDGLQNLRQAGGIMIGTLESSILTSTNLEISLPELRKTGDVIVNVNSAKTLSLPVLESAGKIYVYSSHIEEIEMPELTSCTGNVIIGASNVSNSYIQSLSIPKLTDVSGNLSLQYMTELETLDLPSLRNVDGAMTVSSVVALEKFNCGSLVKVGGEMEISTMNVASLLFPDLISTGGLNINSKASMNNSAATAIDFSSLKEVDGNFSFTLRSDVENLEFPALETVMGKMTMQNLSGVSLMEFPKLTAVGDVVMSAMNMLETVKYPVLKSSGLMTYSLNEIKSVEMNMIEDCKGLTLSGCSNITEFRLPESMKDRFTGTFTVTGCPLLADIYGPEVYGGIVTITLPNTGKGVLPQLHSIDGGMVEMESDFKLTTSYTPGNIIVKGISKIKGQYTHVGSGSSTFRFSLELPDLEEAGAINIGSFYVTSIKAPKLKKISSATLPESIRAEQRGIYFSMLLNLEELYFPSLTEIDGALYLSGNQWNTNKMLINLDGFSSLTNVTGAVTIGNNQVLKDYSGLKNAIRSIDPSKWSATGNLYNPTYQDMLDGNYTAD